MYYGIQDSCRKSLEASRSSRTYDFLFNEKSMRNLTNPQLTYSDEQIGALPLNGTLKSTDWYGAVIRNTALNNSIMFH